LTDAPRRQEEPGRNTWSWQPGDVIIWTAVISFAVRNGLGLVVLVPVMLLFGGGLAGISPLAGANAMAVLLVSGGLIVLRYRWR
jgi:hypothetical protein